MTKTSRQPGRSTRERILTTALALFNQQGEPHVSSTAIAAELEISPGNLYYHFPNKEAIVNALYDAFAAEMGTLLDAMEQTRSGPEEIWLFLHLMFEAIWKYRFLYYDISTLMSGYAHIERHFPVLLRRKQHTAYVLCDTLTAAGLMQADANELTALARNIALVGTFWISFQRAVHPHDEADIALGVAQVMQLVAPLLQPEARRYLQSLATQYTSVPNHAVTKGE